MALTITHTTAADGTFSASGTTNWNANHTLAGSVALNEISAATGAVTIASGNSTGIVWNWANTADSTISFTYGETTAATGGTSTSGVPNQVLLKLATVAASTQSPLSVYSRGTHTFSVSPSAAQILGNSGVQANPTYAFSGAITTGIFNRTGTNLSFVANGNLIFECQSTALTMNLKFIPIVGTAAAPSIADASANTSGFFFGNGLVGYSVSAVENARMNAGLIQYSKGSGDAVSYAVNSRKARGTVALPTVITTGDDLLTESGFGYLGATNTYQEATRITSNSTGTISDATNGIGGILKFLTRKQGVDTAVVERFRVDDAGHLVSIAGTANTPTITAGGGTNPTIVGTDTAFTVTIGTGGVAASVEITFATAYANAPITSAQSDTDILALKSTPLTTKVTITAATPFTAGSNIDCICLGRA